MLPQVILQVHQPKNTFKTLNPMIKLLRKIPLPIPMMLAMIHLKAKINLPPQVTKLSIMMIKANKLVKTGTQMIKMIKRFSLATMRKSKPVAKRG